MTPLKKRMKEELVLRGYSDQTIDIYLSQVARLARHFNRSPDLLDDEQLRAYVLHLHERGLGYSSINQAVSAMRFFYVDVLGRLPDSLVGALPRTKSALKRPRVYLKGLRQRFERNELDFHGKIAGLARPENFDKFLAQAARPKWVVYSKRPFAGPETVLKYLSRYTHRIGITHRRLKAHDPDKRTVTFDYRDYADNSRRKTLTLAYDEFVRRLALHILPPRFVRIRHYGFLANRGRAERVAQLKDRLGEPDLPEPANTPDDATPHDPLRCPRCGQRALRLIGIQRHAVRNKAPPDKP